MKRTQIYLTKEEQLELDNLSKSKGTSKSALIREAVDEYLVKHSEERRKEILNRAAGMWKDREDLPDFEEIRKEWDRFE